MDNKSYDYQKEIKILVNLSSLISSSLDINDVLNNALFCVEKFIDAEVSSIFEVDPEKEELFFRLSRGPGSDLIKEFRLRMGEGIAGWVAQTGTPLICPDTAQDPRFCPRFDELSGCTTRSIICVPLKHKDQLLGVLEVLNKKGGGKFNDDDLEMLTILGNQIGIALENARLYQRLEEKLSFTVEELNLTEKRLKQAKRLAALGKLSQGVAHEVRNPLLIIGGFAHRLQKQLPPDHPAQEMLVAILGAAEKLKGLVREIETLATLPEPNLKPANPAELLRRVLNDHAAALQQQEIEVRLQIPADFPPVPLDERLIDRALSHLISNAREAMPRGGRLEVALALDLAGVQIILNDTGAGISHADLPYIFDPFFSSKPDGTGMGLATVHRIVADHQGEIQISSGVGEGTEVRIWLPR